MLAEQLARELGRGADADAVIAGDALPGDAGIAIRVIAGEPSETDLAYVQAADRAGTPVILVQLWSQADWTPPFVLSPFVVECRPGQGFPIEEIAARIAEAGGGAHALAQRIPVLRGPVARRAVREAVVRAAYLGALRGRRGDSRPLITLEQARLVSRLEATPGIGVGSGPPATAAVVAALLASGFALRGVARATRRVLPAPLADVAIAAGATWALGKALHRFGESGRTPRG